MTTSNLSEFQNVLKLMHCGLRAMRRGDTNATPEELHEADLLVKGWEVAAQMNREAQARVQPKVKIVTKPRVGYSNIR